MSDGWMYRVSYPRSKRDYNGPRDTRTFTDYDEALGLVTHLDHWIHGAPVAFERRKLVYSAWEVVNR